MDTGKSTPNRINTTSNLPELTGGPIKKSFLTPCRRIGLGKSPSGSLKKVPQLNSINHTSKEDQKLYYGNQSPVLYEHKASKIEDSYKLKKKHKICNLTQNCDTQQSLEMCTDSVIKENFGIGYQELNPNDRLCSSLSKETESITSDNLKTKSSIQQLEVTDEMLTHLALEIKEKQEKIKDQYFHLVPKDLTVKKSIDIWRKAGQGALQYLLKINKERGFPTTLAELIQLYGFNIEVLQFVPEDDDFI